MEEITPSRLHGYGELSKEAAAMLETIRAELRAVIERLGRYLAQSQSGDLQEWLAKLESAERRPQTFIACSSKRCPPVAADGDQELEEDLRRLSDSEAQSEVIGVK